MRAFGRSYEMPSPDGPRANEFRLFPPWFFQLGGTDTLLDVSGARIAIDGTDSLCMRAASALLADYRVERIGLIGRKSPAVWGDRTVAITSPRGWDVAIGASAPGVPTVTVGRGGEVSWAGPTGLARVLGSRLGPESQLAGTVQGDPIRSENRFGFPNPIGWLGGEEVDGVYHCPSRGSLSAVMAVQTGGQALVVLDHRDFLDGSLLAAGAMLAAEGHLGPVWKAADRYLELIQDFGLVVADRTV